MAAVKLMDGRSIDLDDAEWGKIAGAVRSTLIDSNSGGPAYRDQNLSVKLHADGRLLIEGIVRTDGEPVATAYDVLAANADPRAALIAVAAHLQLAEFLVKTCLEQLGRK